MTCEPTADEIAIGPCPRRATATACTVSGIWAPIATTYMPRMVGGMPRSSPHLVSTAVRASEVIESQRKEISRVLGYRSSVSEPTCYWLSGRARVVLKARLRGGYMV